MKNKSLIFSGSIFLTVFLFLCNLFFGTEHISFHAVLDILCGQETGTTAWNIVIKSRLPQAITALGSGMALAVSGLMLQTLFRNPLAGPSILGISDGANLGVAIVILYLGGPINSHLFSFTGSLSIVMAAMVGAFVVLSLIIFLSGKIKNNILVLIIGMMISYLASSGISVLNYISPAEKVRSFVMWGMGNFSGVPLGQTGFYFSVLALGLLMAFSLIKPLNLLLLGEHYAANLGVRIARTRILIFICTGILTATVTAFCGPISFIGLAVPHIARLALNSSNHRSILPYTFIYGGIIALFCNLVTVIPINNNILPLNAVTPLIGAPIILYVITRNKNEKYFE